MKKQLELGVKYIDGNNETVEIIDFIDNNSSYCFVGKITDVNKTQGIRLYNREGVVTGHLSKANILLSNVVEWDKPGLIVITRSGLTLLVTDPNLGRHTFSGIVLVNDYINNVGKNSHGWVKSSFQEAELTAKERFDNGNK